MILDEIHLLGADRGPILEVFLNEIFSYEFHVSMWKLKCLLFLV